MKISGRDASLANTTAFSVLPSVSVARELPVPTTIVAVGLSRPYFFKSASLRRDDALHLRRPETLDDALHGAEVGTCGHRLHDLPLGAALGELHRRGAARKTRGSPPCRART